VHLLTHLFILLYHRVTWHNKSQYHTIPYRTIPYHTVPYHTIPHHTISYHTIPYIIISYIVYHISYIIYHISYIIYHISYIIYRISYHTISYRCLFKEAPYNGCAYLPNISAVYRTIHADRALFSTWRLSRNTFSSMWESVSNTMRNFLLYFLFYKAY
jgi:hypothetical protein